MASVALQSKDHRDLLDVVDKLRSQGFGRYVDLPEIIVCGDVSIMQVGVSWRRHLTSIIAIFRQELSSGSHLGHDVSIEG
jgi:hypothetical protein